MQQLPDALAPLGAYRQFILYKKVPSATRPGKTDKFPCAIDGSVVNAHDPTRWLDHTTALNTAAVYGEPYGVGFVFTENDPFFFVDIDDCLNEDGATWSPDAMSLMAALPGAAVEISQSGRGLHIIGTGHAPEHDCKSKTVAADLFTEKRFVALTGINTIGSAATDLTPALGVLVATHFPLTVKQFDGNWTDVPVPEWTGTDNDDELIDKALKSSSAGSLFGGNASFRDLWENNESVLIDCYPDDQGLETLDISRVDAALAQHLAFWTGKNCERIMRLMWRSGLVRDKWKIREGYYLERTIQRAVTLQDTVYSVAKADNTLADQYGAPKLKGASLKQKEFAEVIRAEKLAQVTSDEVRNALCSSYGPTVEAGFWIDNKHETPDTLVSMIKPVETAVAPLGNTSGPEMLAGYQFLGAPQQIEHFKGCVYIQDIHRIFTPNGSLLKPDQFNATYGGYSFQLEATATGKTTRKAWEAFTESQAVRYPKAETSCFRPLIASGALIEQDGRIMVNTYIPINTPRKIGDATPFLVHLVKVLPDEQDRNILLAYMAACIQYKGVKFQWAPLLQGAEGNGKTLFTRCVAFAVGERYTHMPPANEIAEKFNDWLFDRLFIGVEDVYVPAHKQEVIEVLKPMITNDRLAKRAMQQGQVMCDVCANFLLNSNHKTGILKTRNDRRFAMFFTAQQKEADLARDGMAGDYFPNLYNWLKGEGPYSSQGKHYGYSVVSEFLSVYPIPDELNPAKHCHRAPVTTSTDEAIDASMGAAEQEIMEAVDEGRIGFAGGWVSSMAVDRLLNEMRLSRAIPRNKRRDLLQTIGYDWHPALHDGRVNNIVLTDGGKPRLFIKNDHISMNITCAAEVVKAYEKAQIGAPSTSKAGRYFGS